MPIFFTHDHTTGKHHQDTGDGIWTHFSTSCNVHDANDVKSDLLGYVPGNSQYITRLFHSKFGLGVIFYELVGKLTFVSPISATRIAWQRLNWDTDYLARWDNHQIQEAINNFLWVAECEEANAWLARE